MTLNENYRKYKWFFTSSGKLVVGGKSDSQNDELLRSLDKEYVVMHTSHPGSPFCVIVSDISKVRKNDLKECAIFCGCFSRAWKEGKKKTEVDIFKSSQISKPRGAKKGLWKVSGEISKSKIDLELVLTRQNKILRAVPEPSVKKKDVLLKVCPGKIDKREMLAKIATELDDENSSSEEILAALPAGGVRIIK